MPKAEDARETDFEQASESLSQGLKTCRAMVRNYQQMLSADELAPLESEKAAQSAK